MSKKFKLTAVSILCLVIYVCNDSKIIGRFQSTSPDGRWVASATTEQYSGPGTEGVIITVRLKRVGNVHPPSDVLVFEEKGGDPPSVAMYWQNPTHLIVSYRNSDLDFQAVKCGGVDISVQAL